MEFNLSEDIIKKASKIRLLLTDCDGVLTDNGVYYSEQGELMKRFSIRDGMGVERLIKLAGVETGIITGETSESVKKRAEKLKLNHLFLGIKNKELELEKILFNNNLKKSEIAYIGDDVNDIGIMQLCGLTACPQNAMFQVVNIVDYHCKTDGGYGAFREFAELIIQYKNKINQ